MLSDVILKKSLCRLTASWGFLLAWVCTSPSSAAPLKEVVDVQQASPVSTGRRQEAVAEEGELLFIAQNLCYFFLMNTNGLLSLFKDTIILIFEAFLLALLAASLSVSSFYYISFFFHGVFPQICSDFLFCLSVLLRIFVYGYKLADEDYGGDGDNTTIVLEKLFW